MISFGPTEEQELVRDTLREFANEEIRKPARECDEASEIPTAFLDKVWEMGLTTTQIPAEYGGGGEARSPIMNAIALEELAYGDVTLAAAALAPSLSAMTILDHGTDEQKKTYLPAYCGDKWVAGSLALVEPSPAFDALNLRTLAEPKGDNFTLTGTKTFVPFGDRADHFIVVARNAQDGFAGLEAFIVPRDAKGLRISENEKNMGLRGLATSRLELEKVEVSAANRLGGEKGIDGRRLINSSRVATGAALVGLSRAVLEYVVPYAKEREAFDQAIAQKQAIAFMCADMKIEVESMRWLVWKAASQLEQSLDATRSAHHAHIYTTDHAVTIADNGIQVLGGHGFIREHPVEMWYRNAQSLAVLEGTFAL